MPRFSLKYPYFIIVACLMLCIIGVSMVTRMPVDLFPPVRIPVVVVATFYPGMPAQQIERGAFPICPRGASTKDEGSKK